jgi:hypothetical protein
MVQVLEAQVQTQIWEQQPDQVQQLDQVRVQVQDLILMAPEQLVLVQAQPVLAPELLAQVHTELAQLLVLVQLELEQTLIWIQAPQVQELVPQVQVLLATAPELQALEQLVLELQVLEQLAQVLDLELPDQEQVQDRWALLVPPVQANKSVCRTNSNKKSGRLYRPLFLFTYVTVLNFYFEVYPALLLS